MNKIIITFAMMMYLTIGSTANAYDLNYSLHGSNASFLMADDYLMSLNYFSPKANRLNYVQQMVAQGNTHVYVYTRNDGDQGPTKGEGFINPIDAYDDNWGGLLDGLNNSGLKPVLWLTPDDSPSISGQNLQAQKDHFNWVVKNFDSKVTGYVTCLECDEYWSAETVNALVLHLKTITTKPIGVHLTPGVKKEYYANADYVFLQIGFNKSAAEVAAMVKDAMAQTGLPVIASEYDKESRSPQAKALGDAACAAGAVGTGNGRTVSFCGKEEVPMSKDSNDSTVDALVAVGVLVVVAGVAWYLHTNYEFRWIWEAEFTDRYQSFDLGRTFTLMPKDSKGRSLNFDATLGRTQMGFSGTEQNRVTFGIRGTF
jgi:hypothetical protein